MRGSERMATPTINARTTMTTTWTIDVDRRTQGDESQTRIDARMWNDRTTAGMMTVVKKIALEIVVWKIVALMTAVKKIVQEIDVSRTVAWMTVVWKIVA